MQGGIVVIIGPLELPDNQAACHVVIRRQHEMLVAQQVEIQELRTEFATTVERLERKLAMLERQLYGRRRERFVNHEDEAQATDAQTPDNTEPPSATLSADIVPPAPPPPSDSPVPRRTSKGRQPRVLDESYPREKVYHRLDERDVPPALWNHPRAKRFFRFVREEVELQKARIRVIQHYEEVIAVEDEQNCQTQMLAASAPEPLIDRCYLGPDFLAYLAASRFADHIPYYREEDILARTGFSIHRATQCRWMRSLAQLLSPLVELIRERLLLSRVLGIDETPVPLICPERASTRSAYLYAQHGDAGQPYVAFHFASHKTAENVRRIVGDYRGYLQSDAYICYELITAVPSNGILGVGCWAHARRKFEPLISVSPHDPHPQAKWILNRIQRLYDIEDRARSMSNDDRHQLRQRESRPIVDEIERWLEQRHQREIPKTAILEGVNYLRNRWEAFRRFLDDGAIPLDNNRTEADIKGPVMGKKAWLFFATEQGGQTAASLYTLTMSCKRHCIDVQAYLSDVFGRIRGATPEELEALLPDRWIEAHPEARVPQRVEESHAAAYRKRQRRAERRRLALSG
jgi:transposase